MMALTGAVAVWLDGVGITYFQGFLYGSDPDIALRGAAWILFGAGWLLITALFIHCKDVVSTHAGDSNLSSINISGGK